MRFRTMIELGGKTATGFPVPPEVVEALGKGKKRLPVLVTIGEHTYRSTVAPYEEVFMIPLSAENRTAAGVAAGDEVEVALELDTEPRKITVPDDLAVALKGDPEASRFFDTLSYTNQGWYVTWITSAKKQETRDQRVAKAITMLREGRTR